tara:strand:+ start:217 stop:399 length:183 start_codon:yes stop_codon:yes gene_type:complete
MTRPTDQELQTELAQVVQAHNEAQAVVNKMKHRFTEIQAILNDRKTTVDQPATPAPKQTT